MNLHVTCRSQTMFLLFLLGSFSFLVDNMSGFIGDSAVLPCSPPLSEIQGLRIQDVKVHWRDDEGKNVLDIIGGNKVVEEQAPEYKNRVETFPEEYKRGNFSIKLNSLQKTDARKYTCTFTEPFQDETVNALHVKGVNNLRIFIENLMI